MGFRDKSTGWRGGGWPLTAILREDHTVLIARSWQNSLDRGLLLPLLVVLKSFIEMSKTHWKPLLAFTSSRMETHQTRKNSPQDPSPKKEIRQGLNEMRLEQVGVSSRLVPTPLVGLGAATTPCTVGVSERMLGKSSGWEELGEAGRQQNRSFAYLLQPSHLFLEGR